MERMFIPISIPDGANLDMASVEAVVGRGVVEIQILSPRQISPVWPARINETKKTEMERRPFEGL
jgi:hypothetical protein